MASWLSKSRSLTPRASIDLPDRRMIGGNTTNLNDFNNLKYSWVSRLVPAGDEQLLGAGGDQPGART